MRPATRMGTMGPYRTPVPATPPRSEGSTASLVALFGLVLVVLAVCAARREHDPLAELPAIEREQLLERTLDNLALCARNPDAELRSFCEGQAAIARSLPECDDECRALAHSRYPSRAPSARP